MKISVIMSVYDETIVELNRSIDSILNQSCKDFEFLILLDNPDNTEAKVILKNYSLFDSRIKVFENSVNL